MNDKEFTGIPGMLARARLADLRKAQIEVLETLERKIPEILKGIDKIELDSEDGWWETSTGSDFGKSKLEEILSLIKSTKEAAK